jgi:hypothetical protein
MCETEIFIYPRFDVGWNTAPTLDDGCDEIKRINAP